MRWCAHPRDELEGFVHEEDRRDVLVVLREHVHQGPEGVHAQMEGVGGGALVPKCRVQRLYFEKAAGQNGGRKGTWRSVCTVPLGNAPFGGSKEVMKHVGDTPGQGYPTWTRTTAPAHGFQYKPQGTGSGDTRAWVWQTGDDESADHYLPGLAPCGSTKTGSFGSPLARRFPRARCAPPNTAIHDIDIQYIGNTTQYPQYNAIRDDTMKYVTIPRNT